MIFGADRNVTVTRRISTASGQTTIVIQGQGQRPKVLKWPNEKALIGYVGVAQIGRLPTDEWLYRFIGQHLDFATFEDLAESLRAEIEQQHRIDEGHNPPEPLIVHLGGFEKREAHQVPIVWYIRNSYQLENGEYKDIRKEFQKTEEFWQPQYFGGTPYDQIKTRLNDLAANYNPFWFHQGFDLGTFNTIEAFLKAAFRFLVQHHPVHKFPRTLADWEKHLKMAILTYGAYFEAFREPGEQYVGGGVDTVRLDWPA